MHEQQAHNDPGYFGDSLGRVDNDLDTRKGDPWRSQLHRRGLLLAAVGRFVRTPTFTQVIATHASL
jgi:hypothetical protein